MKRQSRLGFAGAMLFALGSAYGATGASLTLNTLTTTFSNIATGSVISSTTISFDSTTLADRGTVSFPSGRTLSSLSLLPGQMATLSLGYSMSAFDEGYRLSASFFYIEGISSAKVLMGEYEGAFADLLLGTCDARGLPATVLYGCNRETVQTTQNGSPDSLAKSGFATTTYRLSAIGESFGGTTVVPQLLYFVQATPNGVTAPIPEPATYVLMLAGLAAVGVVRRGRRHSASSSPSWRKKAVDRLGRK
jgi:hypothetical protein